MLMVRGNETAGVERRRGPRAFGLSALIFGVAMLLWVAPGASAAETLFWNNYSGNSVSFSNIDGSGGGAFNVGAAPVKENEGLTIDSAGGRLIWANVEGTTSNKGSIAFANLDGSGGGPVNTGTATVNAPNGIAVDPANGTLYWSNYEGGPEGKGTISFAKLDGSASGDLNTTGAVIDEPGPIALDTATGRIFWGNGGNNTIYFASLAGGGGGQLDTTGAPPVKSPSGLVIDPTTGKIYWSSSSNSNISFASLAGGGGGTLTTTGAAIDIPYGLALDPVASKLYVGNYGVSKEHANAFLSIALANGASTGLNIASAPVDGPQNPVVLKAPSAVSAPVVTGKPTFHSILTCSAGAWAADFAGSYVYQAPHTYAYQWTRNGTAIAGATASTFTIQSAGSYACTVTAANQAGSAAQASSAVVVKAAKLTVKLTKRKVSVAPGKTAVFKLSVANKGGVPTKGRICTKAPKKAKNALKTPKCVNLAKVEAGKKRVAKVRVKVKPGAGAGSYKLSFKVKGGSGSASASAKLIVVAKK
jgi:DNA-binding beta-propeller fold protein YncE